jgi:protein-S-isoprenylcysteine O-methyltransferase Ste14
MLRVRAIAASVLSLIALGGVIFVAEGTLAYWQGWTFLATVAAGGALVSSVVFRDRDLLRRRMSIKEREPGHLLVQFLVMGGLFASIDLSLLDHRLGWSSVPFATALLGVALVAGAFAVQFFVLRENRFASATIEIATDQRVISTGIYAHIRHPWYLGLLLLFAGIPLVLGSYWALLLLLRLVDEERFLKAHLPGYNGYIETVHWRLFPRIY